MRVRDLMTPSPATCRPDANLQEVARMMRDNDCGAIPVVDNGEPKGVVTDRDIVVRVVAEGQNPRERTARDVMSSPVITVAPNDDAEEAVRRMEERQVRRIVVDEDGRISGIVAQADIARHMPDRKTAEVLEEVSQP